MHYALMAARTADCSDIRVMTGKIRERFKPRVAHIKGVGAVGFDQANGWD
ncbi:hypothetical protein [Sphingomonas sp. Leaf257]|nr:hypothetical protein [Sphingomonas sp. Leaf257]